MTDDLPVKVGGESERDTHIAPSNFNIYQRRRMAKQIVYNHEFMKVAGQGLKYKYLPVEQVKPVVEKAWNESGIVVDVVDTKAITIREPWDMTNQYGDKSRWYHIMMELTIAMVNVDDPEDRVEFTFIGESKDNSDKTYSKAYTAAIKNFFKIEYNVAEGPKDDADALQTDQAIDESNMTPEELEVRKQRQRQEKIEQMKGDPYFGKIDASPDFKTGAQIADESAAPDTAIPTEQEMAQFINVKGALPAFKETVKGFKLSHNAKTPYDLTFDEKAELYALLLDLGAGQ